MAIFERRPERAGLRFWFPVLSLAGAGWGVVILMASALGSHWSPGTVRGVRVEVAVMFQLLMGGSAGVVVGVLNKWVASRTAAMLVGGLAVFPSVFALSWYRLYPEVSALGTILAGLLPSMVIGGIYGALYFHE